MVDCARGLKLVTFCKPFSCEEKVKHNHEDYIMKEENTFIKAVDQRNEVRLARTLVDNFVCLYTTEELTKFLCQTPSNITLHLHFISVVPEYSPQERTGCPITMKTE